MMVIHIAKLKQLTEEIITSIDEVTFEQLEHFVAQRDEIVTALQAIIESGQNSNGANSNHGNEDVTIEHRETIRSILQHDAKIMKRMEELREEASKSLNKIKQGKTHRDTYDIVYSPESIYFDKKK